MPRDIHIPIFPPLGGLNNDTARIAQPANTTIDCRNVFPYGRDFRSRIASRPGTTAYSLTTRGAGTVKLFMQVSSVSGGVIVQTMYAVAGSIGAGAGKGHLYYVNGGVIKEDNASLAATAGSVPTTYAGVVVHRNRLIAYGPDHQWAASKVDDYGNWDYADKTSARAHRHTDIIYNASGSAADPILTAIPWTNDLLVYAGDHSLWALRGDLAMGGRVDLLSNGIGILGPSAWTIDPQGSLWIVGTGGIYRGSGGSFQPMNVGHYSAYFQSINRSTNTTSCAWDRDRNGLWIFSAGKDSLFFSVRDQGFWPMSLGTGITAAGVFDGPASTDRQVLFSDAGNIRSISTNSLTDVGGGDVAGYIYLGPFMPVGPDEQAVLKETVLTLSDQNSGVDYVLQAGNSPYQAYNAPTATASGSLLTAASRQARIRSRLRGTCFYLKLSNPSGAFFEFDNGSMTFSRAGRYHA